MLLSSDLHLFLVLLLEIILAYILRLILQGAEYEEVRTVDRVAPEQVKLQSNLLHKGHFTEIKVAKVNDVPSVHNGGKVVAKLLKSESHFIYLWETKGCRSKT